MVAGHQFERRIAVMAQIVQRGIEVSPADPPL